MFVRCDNDPDVQLAKIPGVTWVAPKLTGTDITGPDEIKAWIERMRARGLSVGGWIYCENPAADVDSWQPWRPLDFIIYDVEAPYKEDETPGGYVKAAQLVSDHRDIMLPDVPAAVTSYGGYKTSIDFKAFADAGWPILAQGYDSFTCVDSTTYWEVGPYQSSGVHCLTRSLTLKPGQAVYRPESIDP